MSPSQVNAELMKPFCMCTNFLLTRARVTEIGMRDVVVKIMAERALRREMSPPSFETKRRNAAAILNVELLNKSLAKRGCERRTFAVHIGCHNRTEYGAGGEFGFRAAYNLMDLICYKDFHQI